MAAQGRDGVVKLKLNPGDSVVVGDVVIVAEAVQRADAVVIGDVLVATEPTDSGGVALVIQAPKTRGIVRIDRRRRWNLRIGSPIPEDVAREVEAKGERMGRPCST